MPPRLGAHCAPGPLRPFLRAPTGRSSPPRGGFQAKKRQDGVGWEVTPPQKPPSKRPNAQTVILVGIAIGLALLSVIALALRYL
jgi:hypothetical protein